MPAVMKLINNLNNINTCFSNGYELRGSMGNRQAQQPSHNNNKDSIVMNGGSSNHLTRSAARNRLKEPLTVECNGFANSVSVRSDGVLVEKDTPGPGRLCRNKSKSCPGNGSQLGPLSPTDAVRPRRNIWKLPSCLLGTTAEDTRARGTTNSPATKTDTKSNHTSVPCKYNLSHDKSECKVLSKIQEESNTNNHIEKYYVRHDRKLLEDNREYYKVEVLSAKLRSTRQFVKEYEARKLKEEREEEEEEEETNEKKNNNKTETNSEHEEQNGEVWNERKTRQSQTEDSIYLSRKNLKLRHSRDSPEQESSTPVKRFRPNKITMIERLNMEADKFMFGDPRRELEEQESSPDTAAPKRKRKSHVELFLIDNLDYYKFELPASRLRNGNDIKTYREELNEPEECKGTIKIDFENVKYSFEMGIQQELWYQVFLRSRSRTKQSLWQNKVPHQSKILLPFERKTRPGVNRTKQEILPPPPPPPEPETIQSHRRRKRRLSSIIEDDSRPRKSPRCHASTQAILSSHHIPGGVRRSLLEEDSCTSGADLNTPLHEPENFPECCEFARINTYSCDVRRLVDKLAKQLKLDVSQVNLCEILRQYSRSYYSSLNSDVTGGTGSSSQPGDNSSDCGASSHLSSEGTGSGTVVTGKRRERKKRRINMTGWPCRPKRKVAGKVVNYNENLAASFSSSLSVVPTPPSLSSAVDRTTSLSTTTSTKKKRGRKRRKGKSANRYKY